MNDDLIEFEVGSIYYQIYSYGEKLDKISDYQQKLSERPSLFKGYLINSLPARFPLNHCSELTQSALRSRAEKRNLDRFGK